MRDLPPSNFQTSSFLRFVSPCLLIFCTRTTRLAQFLFDAPLCGT
jgi:hypothetical protein